MKPRTNGADGASVVAGQVLPPSATEAVRRRGNMGRARRPSAARWFELILSRQGRRVLTWRYAEKIGRRMLGHDLALAADPHFARGLSWLPSNRFLLVLHAVGAQNSDRAALAVERWKLVSQALPDLSLPYCRLSAAYRNCGLFHRANEVMEKAAALFPEDLETMVEFAVVSAGFAAVPRAAECWIKAVDLSGGASVCLVAAAQTLTVLGRFEEAQGFVVAGRERYPDDRALAAAEAMLAAAREDWPVAVGLWSAYRKRYPDDEVGIEHYGRVVENGRLASFAGESLPVPQDLEPTDEVRSMLLNFQSIGDNCEFGLVQRHFGLEPLGLLRWNKVDLRSLIAALDAGFEGVGEAEHTSLEMLGSGEFFARDRRFQLAMHTFHFKGHIDQSVLFAKMCKRVVHLRRKFLADLASSEFTFVFRTDTIGDADVLALHDAMRRYGSPRLLAVRPAEKEELACSVRSLRDGCFIGLTSRPGDARDNRPWNIPFAEWLGICRCVSAA